MSNVSVLEINESAIAYNLAYFKAKLNKKTKLLAVVKAFSYGSDSVILSKILQKKKVDYLAVAYADEGVLLRKNGIELPVLVLHPQTQNLEILINNNLEPNIYSFKILNDFIEICKKKEVKNYAIHLKFNTGLNRLGFSPKDVEELILKIKTHSEIKIASVFSHLVASEAVSEREFTLHQIKLFTAIKEKIENLLDYQPLFHQLNTSGILNYPEAQFDMVRLGIGIYGFANDAKITNNLKNVLSLKSVISQIHTIKKGQSVGYNKGFIAQKETKSATIPIGHADGISRKLGNGVSFVLINNQKANILGNVCMDMIMVDVSNIHCNEGDEVVIFNSQKMIEYISMQLQTIPYEFLTMISQRVRRILV